MKKHVALRVLLSMTLALLASCGAGGESGTLPTGMKIGEVGDGYTLYVPEDWTVERSTGVTMAYVSAVDTTNVTLVRVPSDKAPSAYLESYAATLSETLTEYALLEADVTELGGKSAAYRIFTGKVAGVEYRYLQTAASVDGVIYLLTYTARTEIPSGDVSYYDRYVKKVLDMIEVFLFEGEAADTTTERPTPEGNGEGLYLASDPAVSRYSLWVPADWTVDLANGTTSVFCEGAVVTVTYEIPEEATLLDYWATKSGVYQTLYPSYTLIESECSAPAEKREDVEVWLDEHQAVRYVFTYEAGGVTYKVQKLLAVDGLYVYTLSYTARLTPLADGSVPYLDRTDDLRAMIDAFAFD